MTEDAIQACSETLASGQLAQGEQVDKFETALSKFLNYEHIATINNATAGLHLGLRLANVQPGDTVISTPFTCWATNAAVLNSYANIQWADSNPNTCTIDIDDVVAKVHEDVKAIVVVHWGGIPADVEDLKQKVINKLGYCPPIIEDCAQAFGGYYHDGVTRIGTNGNYCAFSFQAIKHLTTGDGGLITVPEKDIKKVKRLRWFGIDRDYQIDQKRECRSDIPVIDWGYKYNMNDVAATIGIHNLKQVEDKAIKVHQENARYYNKNLSNINGVTLFDIPKKSIPSYWLYTIKVEDRINFRLAMYDRGIFVSTAHNRNDIHPCVTTFKCDLPQLDSFSDKYICIPVGWWVTPEDREYIVESIKKGW